MVNHLCDTHTHTHMYMYEYTYVYAGNKADQIVEYGMVIIYVCNIQICVHTDTYISGVPRGGGGGGGAEGAQAPPLRVKTLIGASPTLATRLTSGLYVYVYIYTYVTAPRSPRRMHTWICGSNSSAPLCCMQQAK